MNIDVRNFKFLSANTPLKAFCTVVFPDSDFEIRDVRIIQQTGQKAFVTGPQKEYTDKNGKKAWFALVSWGRDSKLGALIQRSVLAASEKSKPHLPDDSPQFSRDSPQYISSSMVSDGDIPF